MKEGLGLLSKLVSRICSIIVKAMRSEFVKIMSQRPNLTTGQLVGSSIGVLAVLFLAWWTVGISSNSFSLLPSIIVLVVGVILGLPVMLISRERYSKLVERHFGWIPVTLGAFSYWYWIWYANGTGTADQGFFETAAQVLPVLLLAAIVDVRQSSTLKSHQLALPIIAIFLGEIAALNEAAFHVAATAVGRVSADFAVVASGLVTAVVALIMAVLAELKQKDL